MTTEFSAAEHEPYLAAGRNTIAGQAFLRQSGGGTVTCAGADVLMLPATPYFKEMIEIARGGGAPAGLQKLDPRFKGVVRMSQCNAQGNFTFEKVPAGRYIVGTQVRWRVGSSAQGGDLTKEIDVVDGASNNFLLSDRDRP